MDEATAQGLFFCQQPEADQKVNQDHVDSRLSRLLLA